MSVREEGEWSLLIMLSWYISPYWSARSSNERCGTSFSICVTCPRSGRDGGEGMGVVMVVVGAIDGSETSRTFQSCAARSTGKGPSKDVCKANLKVVKGVRELYMKSMLLPVDCHPHPLLSRRCWRRAHACVGSDCPDGLGDSQCAGNVASTSCNSPRFWSARYRNLHLRTCKLHAIYLFQAATSSLACSSNNRCFRLSSSLSPVREKLHVTLNGRRSITIH